MSHAQSMNHEALLEARQQVDACINTVDFIAMAQPHTELDSHYAQLSADLRSAKGQIDGLLEALERR